jgi:hypothetical protein
VACSQSFVVGSCLLLRCIGCDTEHNAKNSNHRIILFPYDTDLIALLPDKYGKEGWSSSRGSVVINSFLRFLRAF